jgi:aromatic-L-amino-acid decarboxylase
LRQKPVTRRADRRTMEERLREPVPERGTNALEVSEQLQRDVFTEVMHLDHPRFFAFVPSPSNFVSVMADALASGFNVFAGTWLESSGPAQVELVTVDWLRELCGLPEGAGGLFVSGGSVANITALAVARRVKLADRAERALVYCSDQTHSSIQRGLRILGFAPDQLRKLPTDDDFRLDPGVLRDAVAEDRSAGFEPFCVVANAGTTNTGAVDPLRGLSELCRKEDLWLHADGAYGAAGMLCERGRSLLEGLDLVDSLSLDPHKWLFQPYEIGCVLVRDRRLLRETFRILPEYLEDVNRGEEEVNFCDYGVQLTRGFRALKLWMSLKVFGLAAFGEAVERGFELAEVAERALRGSRKCEVVTPASMGIVTFRYVPEGLTPREVDVLNVRMVEGMIQDGFAMLSSTTIFGRPVLRMCAINPRTTDADISETIERLERLGDELVSMPESDETVPW